MHGSLLGAALLAAAAPAAGPPPDWAHPSAAEMSRALAAGFATPQPSPALLASDQAPFARLAWRGRARRVRALILTPPLRCAWEHGVLYAAYGRSRPALAAVAADCRGLAVLYIDSAAVAGARFALELRAGGRRWLPRAARPDPAPVRLRDAAGPYFEFANLYFFDVPPGIEPQALTLVFTNAAGRHVCRLGTAAFRRDERRLRAALR